MEVLLYKANWCSKEAELTVCSTTRELRYISNVSRPTVHHRQTVENLHCISHGLADSGY